MEVCPKYKFKVGFEFCSLKENNSILGVVWGKEKLGTYIIQLSTYVMEEKRFIVAHDSKGWDI